MLAAAEREVQWGSVEFDATRVSSGSKLAPSTAIQHQLPLAD